MKIFNNTYEGYVLNMNVLEGFIKDDLYDSFREKVVANETTLPYPFYCCEDRWGNLYLVIKSYLFTLDRLGLEPSQPCTFKEAISIVLEAFDAYLEVPKHLIDDLAQQFYVFYGFEDQEGYLHIARKNLSLIKDPVSSKLTTSQTLNEITTTLLENFNACLETYYDLSKYLTNDSCQQL